MALGKNIKKKKLIPDPGTKQEETPQLEKPPVIEQESIDIPKEVEQERHVEKTILQEPEPEVKVAEVRTNENLYLSTAEFKRRKILRAKFEEDLKQLRGKKLHLIVFKIGEERFALDIQKTKEVVITPTITPKPHAPIFIKGIINIRGAMVSVMDLAVKFKHNDSVEKNHRYTLVIESDSFNLGLLIHSVPETLISSGDKVRPVDSVFAETSLQETYIKGVITTENGLIYMLDIDEMIEGDKIKELNEEEVHHN